MGLVAVRLNESSRCPLCEPGREKNRRRGDGNHTHRTALRVIHTPVEGELGGGGDRHRQRADPRQHGPEVGPRLDEEPGGHGQAEAHRADTQNADSDQELGELARAPPEQEQAHAHQQRHDEEGDESDPDQRTHGFHSDASPYSAGGLYSFACLMTEGTA